MAVKRREFCWLAGLSVLGAASGKALSVDSAEAAGSGAAATIGEPLEGKRWAMVVDLQACRKEEGCRDCIEACHTTHNVPELDDPAAEIEDDIDI